MALPFAGLGKETLIDEISSGLKAEDFGGLMVGAQALSCSQALDPHPWFKTVDGVCRIFSTRI